MKHNAKKKRQLALTKEIKYSEETVSMNEKYFRPKSVWHKVDVHFLIPSGGLGDLINWTPALEWSVNENHHMNCFFYFKEPFKSVAEFIFKDTPRVKVRHIKDFQKYVKDGDAVLDFTNVSQYINATGAHLLDLGFMLFCCSSEPYQGYNRLPSIKFYDDNIDETLGLALDGRPYAVFTPGATTRTRAMPAEAFNELVRYTYDLGIIPVFLGKKEFLEDFKTPEHYTQFDEGYDFGLGVDLRDQTTLLQATQIMSGARFVLGVDNGLLHFAGCTEAPIIFGHTITTVKQRDIRRPKGVTINISLDKKDLPCIGCQANMRFIFGHSFKKCVYDDYKCLELLFSDKCKTWKKAIDLVLQNVR